jgi:hypothetical protein
MGITLTTALIILNTTMLLTSSVVTSIHACMISKELMKNGKN